MLGQMQKSKTMLVLISGPVGVGKTSVAEELSGLLETANVGHTFVDLDGLAKTFPRPNEDRYGENIALKNLSAVWANAYESGVRNLIVARVIETTDSAKRIQHAVGAETAIIVQLMASDETLFGRVRRREIGSGRAWHERRSLELSKQFQHSSPADMSIDTSDKSIELVANEIRELVDWV